MSTSTIYTPSTTDAANPAAKARPSSADLARLPNIGLMGKAGAGKTTIAKILKDYGYYRLSFASRIRDVAGEIWGEAGLRPATLRGYLQGLGVAVRELDPDAWVNALFRYHRNELRSTARIVIDDVRFPNEAWRLRSEGFILIRVLSDQSTRVTRLKANGKLDSLEQLEHASETALDAYGSDYEIANSGRTFREIETDLIAILNKELGRG